MTASHIHFHEAVKIIRKNYGEGSIMRLSDSPIRREAISTGCLSVDIATGIGGLPKGRVTEVYGRPAGGKSTLALQTAVQAQREGLVAYVDVEQALDPEYAAALGVDVDSLFLSQPDCGEEALEIVETIIRSGDVAMVVIDSVDALVPRAVIEGEMGQSLPALQARLMSQAMRKLSGVTRKSNTVLLFINQIRKDLGMGGYGGPKDVTSGGFALQFYASMRIEVRNIGAIKDGDDQHIANKVKVEIKKNKVAVPFKKCEVELTFGKGFNAAVDLLDLGVDCKIIEKSGAWFGFRGQRLGQGRTFSATFLRENPEISDTISKAVRQIKGLDVLPEESNKDRDAAEEGE